MEIVNAGPEHIHFAKTISQTIEESAKDRGTGIAQRSPAYIIEKMQNGNAVIAFEEGTFAGFCYIEVWGHGKYVAHSGLIVSPTFRGQGLAKRIKKRVFDLSLKKFPGAKIFGITTGQAVMKINYELGYKPVHFSELTDDPEFWKGCQTC
jgi:GNAT superfamily N-acetyltransferase